MNNDWDEIPLKKRIISKDFCNRILLLRNMLFLTKSQMASSLSTRVKDYINYEKGILAPTKAVLIKLSEITNNDLSYWKDGVGTLNYITLKDYKRNLTYYKNKNKQIREKAIVAKPFADLGKQLLEYRRSKGWSGEMFAKKIYITKSYYSYLERGIRKPSYNVAFSLEKLTGIPQRYWLGESTKENLCINTSYNIDIKNNKMNIVNVIQLLKRSDILNSIDTKKMFENTKFTSIERLLIEALKEDILYIQQLKKEM